MKKRIVRIGIVLTLIFALVYYKGDISTVFKSPTASAIGDLSVDWGVAEGNPIFVVSNMAPGDDESRTVTVHNDASTPKPVSIRAIKTSETGLLSNAFSFVISQNGIDLYGGTSPTGPKTLNQFFAEGSTIDGIPLSTLQSNTSINYTFSSTFLPDSGDNFQNKQLVFDLQIGIAIETPTECDAINFSGNPIYGTEKNDILRGTSGNDLIFSFEANDTIYAGGGNDCIVSGTDNDVVFSGAGNDVLIGGSGNDSLFGGFGNDVIIGNSGPDIANGEAGLDTCNAEVRLSCER